MEMLQCNSINYTNTWKCCNAIVLIKQIHGNVAMQYY